MARWICLLLAGCGLREHPLPSMASEPEVRARSYAGVREWQPRNGLPRGTLYGYYADAPHLVRFGQEMFAAAALVKHLDQHQRLAWDTVGHDVIDTPEVGGTVDRARRMYALARATFLGIHRVSRLNDTRVRIEEADRLTREAFCQAANIPTPNLAQLPGWAEVAAEQVRSLARAGVETERLADGRLALAMPVATFASGSAALSPAAATHLGAMATRIDGTVLVEGHTDPVPISDALRPVYPSNLELGQARARAVADALIAGGFPDARLRTTSRAATEPPDGGGNPRRVEIVVEDCR